MLPKELILIFIIAFTYLSVSVLVQNYPETSSIIQRIIGGIIPQYAGNCDTQCKAQGFNSGSCEIGSSDNRLMGLSNTEWQHVTRDSLL